MAVGGGGGGGGGGRGRKEEEGRDRVEEAMATTYIHRWSRYYKANIIKYAKCPTTFCCPNKYAPT